MGKKTKTGLSPHNLLSIPSPRAWYDTPFPRNGLGGPRNSQNASKKRMRFFLFKISKLMFLKPQDHGGQSFYLLLHPLATVRGMESKKPKGLC